MTIDLIRILVDFGLVVLIWMVQLIVYPSFSRYSVQNLIPWHKIYTQRLAVIVIPLMFTQVFAVAYQLYKSQELYTYLSALLVVLVWIATFAKFVPLHNNIAKETKVNVAVGQLTQGNWMRTAIWTVLFLISLWYRLTN